LENSQFLIICKSFIITAYEIKHTFSKITSEPGLRKDYDCFVQPNTMRGNKNDGERCNFIAEKVIELVIENRKCLYIPFSILSHYHHKFSEKMEIIIM
jgi:hypothetical protein